MRLGPGVVAFLAGAILATEPASAGDASAAFLANLFVEACVPHLGQPDQVREWALSRGLKRIEEAKGRAAVVGSGGKGEAWSVPSADGSFALSLRGETGSCAVWAQKTAAADALSLFQTLVESVAGAGVDLHVERDEAGAGRRLLTYEAEAPGAGAVFEFTLLTLDRPDALYQAMMEAGRGGE